MLAILETGLMRILVVEDDAEAAGAWCAACPRRGTR